jgi:hypothetical protein
MASRKFATDPKRRVLVVLTQHLQLRTMEGVAIDLPMVELDRADRLLRRKAAAADIPPRRASLSSPLLRGQAARSRITRKKCSAC